MTWLFAFPLAALVGFATAAPVGPVNLICARRTLQHGFWPGFSAGLGAAAAEAIYAAIAVGGLSLVSEGIAARAEPLRMIAGFALLVLAVVAWRAPATPPAREDGNALPSRRLAAGSLAAFALALSNPIPLLSMGVGLAAARSLTDAPAPPALEFAGLVVGSVLWWAVLATSLCGLRKRLGNAAIQRLNRAVAVAFAGFGLAALWA